MLKPNPKFCTMCDDATKCLKCGSDGANTYRFTVHLCDFCWAGMQLRRSVPCVYCGDVFESVYNLYRHECEDALR